MTKISALARVEADGTLEIRVRSALPPGEHAVVVIVDDPEMEDTAAIARQMTNFPIDRSATASREPVSRAHLYPRRDG